MKTPVSRIALLLAAFPLFLAAEDAPLFRSAFPLDALRSVSQGDAKVAAEILIRKIVEQQGYAYTTEIPRDHATFLTEMRQDRYDFFLIFGYDFLRYRDTYGMTPKLAGVRDGDDPLNEILLLLPSAGLDSARGGKLVVQRGSGELPMTWLEEEFANRGLAEPARFFSAIEQTESTSQTVLSVFFGKAAACVVTRESFELMAELNPQLERKLTVFAASPPLLTSVMCVRDGFREINPGTIVKVGTGLHHRPDGSQILTLMRVEKLVEFQPAQLTSLEELLQKRAARLAEAQTQPDS